jgi:hypothetical protein
MLPLGRLQKKYFEKVGKDIYDPGFKEMFETINRERIFLMKARETDCEAGGGNLKLRTAPTAISKEQLEQIRALRQA